MVFGQLYVALTQPMGTNQQMLKVDLKGIRSSTDFNVVMKQIASKKGSKYHQMLKRTQLAARIDAVSYVVIGLIIGLYNYYSIPEEERSGQFLNQMIWPVGIAVALAAFSLLGAAFPIFAMAGYRSELAEMVDVCGADFGKGFDKCWSKYAQRQARIQAARIQADAARDAANTQANAMMTLGSEFLAKK